MPKAGLLAPKDEKAFVKCMAAYMSGDHQSALGAFQESMARDTSQAHVAEEMFAAFSLLALARHEEAIASLRKVLASPLEVPDPLVRKRGIGGETNVRVTPEISVVLTHCNLAAALLLAKLLQHTRRTKEAAELL